MRNKLSFAAAPNAGTMGSNGKNTLHWFRLGLRLHDNPALLKAVCEAQRNKSSMYVLFIVDRTRFPLPVDANAPVRMSAARHNFLHECLADLDKSLSARGSRLLYAHGEPVSVLRRVLEQWKVGLLTYEVDIAPYSKQRDEEVMELAEELGVEVYSPHSKTLHDLDRLLEANGGKAPLTYTSFQKLFASMGPVPETVSLPAGALPAPDLALVSEEDRGSRMDSNEYVDSAKLKFPGGETEALARMERTLSRRAWVAAFEKPKTSPNSLEPDTTVLSPHLAMGTLSPRLFWHRLAHVYRSQKKHTSPPVSLHGQLLFREYFHCVGTSTTNYGKMVGNPICKQIPWGEDDELLQAWSEARTGYPFIDAIMTQLREEGWIHHLGRHAVACFLTRGDLWQSWEKGASVFEKYLLDGDWSVNIANWLWLSASAFFFQYYRVYSPISFGKKTDPEGKYIKRYLPVLRNMPTQYIYAPWTAPAAVQQRAGCIVGKDYPKPIVEHDKVSKLNMEKMKQAYAAGAQQQTNGARPPAPKKGKSKAQDTDDNPGRKSKRTRTR